MIFCSRCGEKNADDANFCYSCGVPITTASNSDQSTPVNQSTANRQNGSPVFAILGWIFNGISTLLIPILFGAGGVICGYLHKKNNNTHGTIIMIAGVACGLFGTILGAASAGY